jgi:chromosome segregation ATPase
VTLKDQLTEAQTRITELELALATATEANEKNQNTFAELTLKLVTAETKISEQETEISGLHDLLEASEKCAEETEAALEQLQAEQLKRVEELEALKASVKSVEELADSKAREIAARNGAALPAKQPAAGDKTTEGNITAGLRGMAKAIAYLASRQPTPLTV